MLGERYEVTQLIVANHINQVAPFLEAGVKMLSSLLLLLLSVVSAIQCQPFTATISTSDHYQLGEKVTCKVTITNDQNVDYYLLQRGTPLDAINTNLLGNSRRRGLCGI